MRLFWLRPPPAVGGSAHRLSSQRGGEGEDLTETQTEYFYFLTLSFGGAVMSAESALTVVVRRVDQVGVVLF